MYRISTKFTDFEFQKINYITSFFSVFFNLDVLLIFKNLFKMFNLLLQYFSNSVLCEIQDLRFHLPKFLSLRFSSLKFR